jgi:hypothetical protein
LPGLAWRNLVVATAGFTLTDHYGARVMFRLVSALTIVPVLLLVPAHDAYPALVVVGSPGCG